MPSLAAYNFDDLPTPSSDWAVFFDLDGTLLDIAERPGDVVAAETLAEDLTAASIALEGALAIVTGRPISFIDHILAPAHLPAAGQHGAELRVRPDAKIVTVGGTSFLKELTPTLQRLVSQHPGTELEVKSAAIAVHYRRAPEHGEALGRAMDELEQAYAESLHLLRGRMVFELRLPGVDKGGAVETFLKEPPFMGRRPVFIGDDKTDEDGFRIVLAQGGLAIQVAPGTFPMASAHLDGPEMVRAWLATFPAAIARG